MKATDKKERGQSLVELAFSLIVLLSLLLGAVEFSLALFQYVTIRDAAQEGAVFGSINPTKEGEVKARALDAASDVLGGGQLILDDIEVFINGIPAAAAPASQTCEGLTGGTPNAIRVDIGFDHNIFLPLVGPMIGTDTIRLRASVTNTILSPTCPLP